MQKDQLKEKYLNSAILYRGLEKKEERHLVILSVLRLFIFIGGLILIWAAFTKSIPAGIILSLLITFLFIFLLKLFSDYSQKREFLGNPVSYTHLRAHET